jgi:hypothetical protein
MFVTIEEMENLIAVAKKFNRPISIDWVNRKIEVLSATKPTFKKNGERLILSSGPAFHRDILGVIAEVASPAGE